jgi:hypothetical protein
LMIVIVSAREPVPDTFVAVNVTLKVPKFVGAPEINPVVEFTVKPGGKPVAPNDDGKKSAVI